MANDVAVTIIGNTTGDAEIRFTPQGKAVANFTVASTPRSYNKQTNQWEDQEALFLRCSLWGEAAERMAESITKGTRVIVSGKLKQRSFESKGEKRTVIELDVEEIGPSIRYAAVSVKRAERASRKPVDDPWGEAPNGSDGFTPADDEPSF